MEGGGWGRPYVKRGSFGLFDVPLWFSAERAVRSALLSFPQLCLPSFAYWQIGCYFHTRGYFPMSKRGGLSGRLSMTLT